MLKPLKYSFLILPQSLHRFLFRVRLDGGMDNSPGSGLNFSSELTIQSHCSAVLFFDFFSFIKIQRQLNTNGMNE